MGSMLLVLGGFEIVVTTLSIIRATDVANE
jgi:hypothetical protein